MEGSEHQEEPIQEGKKNNDRYKPTLAWTSRTTEASNHQAQSQTLWGQKSDQFTKVEPDDCFHFQLYGYLSVNR